MDRSIEVPFGIWTEVGPRNHRIPPAPGEGVIWWESPSPLQSIGNIWHMVDILNLICYVTAETLSVLQQFVVVVTSACCRVSTSTLQSVTAYIMRTHQPTVCSQGRVLFTTWLPASTSLTAASVQTSASLTLPMPPRSVDRYLCYSALDYLCFLAFGMLTG